MSSKFSLEKNYIIINKPVLTKRRHVHIEILIRIRNFYIIVIFFVLCKYCSSINNESIGYLYYNIMILIIKKYIILYQILLIFNYFL